MISDHELWACASHILTQYQDEANEFIAQRIAALALKADADGLATWKQIAWRLDRLREKPPLRQ